MRSIERVVASNLKRRLKVTDRSARFCDIDQGRYRRCTTTRITRSTSHCVARSRPARQVFWLARTSFLVRRSVTSLVSSRSLRILVAARLMSHCQRVAHNDRNDVASHICASLLIGRLASWQPASTTLRGSHAGTRRLVGSIRPSAT